MYPGDYLVARQFFPELRDTTLKTFLEICPKELIVEYRVADAIVKIRSQGGKVSNILFRHLEEPDKHRSLNLNGFYIDESSQVSEAAFLLLQGRLRGRHVRKGILTTNSDGRTWGWRYFVQQSMFRDEETKALYANIRAPSTENKHLPEDYVRTMLASWSDDRIRREIYADEEIFEGAVYPEFRRDMHVIKPFAIPETWNRFVGADHGFSNPACWLWGAIDHDSNIYVYREYYEKEKVIREICQDVTKLNLKDKLDYVAIDPSVRAVRSQTGVSDWDAYLEYLPKNIALVPAKNDVEAGINRVKTYLKPHPATNRPKLFIFDSCTQLLDEFAEYRWEELSPGQREQRNAKETPRKYKDHAMDALRYLVMSRPEPPHLADELAKHRNEATLEGSVQRELHSKRTPPQKDPFGDF
jgi:PBSX family phage terminase large subunit